MIRKTSILLFAALFAAACSSTNPNDQNAKTKRGAAIGATAGAVAGAVIGNQSSNPRTGAVAGAVIGGAVGAAIGHRLDKQQQELQKIQGVEVTRPAQNEISVAMTSDILFDFDSDVLRAESRRNLDNLAANLSSFGDSKLLLVGHTDDVGSDPYNLDLSRNRATAVASYLMSKGVASSRVETAGRGESEPIATNDTDAGRQQNRRVEIAVYASDKMKAAAKAEAGVP